MSLSTPGVWAVGVWATTVWADGVWQESAALVVVTSADTGGGNWRKLPRKQKRIRYSDYANREEYAAALAQALADSSITIHADSEDDEEELDDDAIIQALTLVMTDERRTH